MNMDNTTNIIQPYPFQELNPVDLNLCQQQVTIEYDSNNQAKVSMEQIELLETIIINRFSSLLEIRINEISSEYINAQHNLLIRNIQNWHSAHAIQIGKHQYKTKLYTYVQFKQFIIKYMNNIKGFDINLSFVVNKHNSIIEYSLNGKSIPDPFNYITKCIEVFDRKLQKRNKISFNRMKLHCPICEKCSKYVYTCGHFICGICLEELEHRDNFKCPSCNTKQNVIELFPNK